MKNLIIASLIFIMSPTTFAKTHTQESSPARSVEGHDRGGGDEVGIEFRAIAEYTLLNFLDSSSNSSIQRQSNKLKATLKKMIVLTTDSPIAISDLGVIQNSIASNDPSTGVVVVNRGRWKQIRDFRIKSAICLHEILSLVKIETSGNYDLSARYLLSQGYICTTDCPFNSKDLKTTPSEVTELPLRTNIQFDSNVPDEVKHIFLTDLAFVFSIKGNRGTQLHQQIFGDVDGNDYQKYFLSRIHSVTMGYCGSTEALACLIPILDEHKLVLNPKYNPSLRPQIARIMEYFNIARHADPENHYWAADTCPDPFLDANGDRIKSPYNGLDLSGTQNCDKTLFGAYASTAIMLKNISMNCSNCSSETKSDARAHALNLLLRVIDPKVYSLIVNDSF